MPAYNPPDAHYCHIKAYENQEDNFKLIGPKGNNFKRLTNKLNIEYLWWNIDSNVIEIWGPFSQMLKSRMYLEQYKDKFYKKHCQKTEIESRDD